MYPPPPTCSVRSAVVSAEHLHVRFVPERHLGDVRHQVAEVLGGILADPAGRVGANRVEVAQRDDIPPLPERRNG